MALRAATDTQYEQARIAAQWEIFRNQSMGNELLAASFDSLAGNASNAFTGILTGSMSAQEAMQSLASNALNSLINGFVQMGVDWVKSAVMGAAAQTSAIATTTAAQTAGLATTTAASTAAATTTMAVWTPAAAVASIGSFGGAAAIGIGALIAAMAMAGGIAGKRKNGGPVSAGRTYQVGEGGMPEIYQASNGSQYMIPGDNGKVISNKDLNSGSAGGGVVVNINNYTGATVDAQATPDGKGGWSIDAFIYDMDNGGIASQAIQRNFTAPRKARS
ncbi:Tail protein (Tape measure) [Citrobacter portucalensis]